MKRKKAQKEKVDPSGVVLKNCMEDMVMEAMEGWFGNSEPGCRCERCRRDIMALALNHLPPKYVVSHQGEIFTQMEGLRLQSKTDVMFQVLEAIKKVTKNPRHASPS